MAFVAHYGVEDWAPSISVRQFWDSAFPWRTPEECPRLGRCLQLQVSCYRSYCLYGLCARRIARQQDVEVCKVVLLQPSVNVRDLFCCGLDTFPLFVGGVITCAMLRMVSTQHARRREGMWIARASRTVLHSV